MIKGAIFDLDGTLINSLIFWDMFWAKFGKRYFDDENFRPTLEEDKMSRTATVDEASVYFHKQYGVGDSPNDYVDFFIQTLQWFYENIVKLKDGVYEFLESLSKNGVKMIIATATSPKLVDIVLKKTKLDRFFPIFVSCDDVGVGKSKPDVFLFALSKIGTNIEDTFVFEDSSLAVETAKSVNFKVVGVYDDNNFNQDKIKKLSTFYLDKGESFIKLIDLLK